MLIARVQAAAGAVFARRDGEQWQRIEDPFAAFASGRLPQDAGERVEGALLAPTEPVVIVGIAQNGVDHPAPVQAWLKSPRTVVRTGHAVTLRRDAGTCVVEGEVAVVIGRDTDGLTRENAHEYVLGITAVNDISSPDRIPVDPRNFEAKGGDGYTPLGGWIDTEASIDDASLELIIDGETVARTGTHELPTDIRGCLAYVTRWVRLGPGDIVMTGAPIANAPVQPGATVEVVAAGVRLVTPTN